VAGILQYCYICIYIRLKSMAPISGLACRSTSLILIVLSRLYTISDEDVAIDKEGGGVAHSCSCAPAFVDMRLADACC